MDPNTVVLDISSDEEADSNDVRRAVSDVGDDSDDVVVVSEDERPVKKLKLKIKLKLKHSLVELDDDCVVLDEDPNAAEVVRDENRGNGDDDEDDIVVVSEKGQVACRDYPHSRHLCIKFPFSTTPNKNHCNQCYCYVCDSLAPCVYWGNGSGSADHCCATDKDEFWRLERKNAKNGTKVVPPVSQLPQVNLRRPTPVTVQSPDIVNQYRQAMLASRYNLHPGVASQIVHRVQQKYNVGSGVRKPLLKKTGSLERKYCCKRSRNPVTQQNYGSLQPNAANASVPYPPQSQIYTSSTVNQPQPQFSNHSNPSFQSHVNSYPITKIPLYQQHLFVPVPTLSSQPQPQPASSQLTYMVPAQPSGPSYPVLFNTKVDGPSVPVSDFAQNTSQGNRSPIVDSGFKDYGLGLPTGQDSATLEGPVSTNESSLGVVSDDLATYPLDWGVFDNHPIEPGFADYSFESTFIDTGPIFNF